jgi:hypothetical protein
MFVSIILPRKSICVQILSVFCVSLLLPGCIKDKLNAEFSYHGTLAFPVAKIDFTLEEALEGDTVYTIGTDNSVRLAINKNNFFQLNAADLLEDITGDISESLEKESSVGAISVDDQESTFVVPFAQIVQDFQDPALKNLLIGSNGTEVVVPAFQQTLTSELTDITFDDFNYLKVNSAKVTLTVNSALFLNLTNVRAIVVDVNSGQTLADLVFAEIPTNSSQSSMFFLNNVTLGKRLKVLLKNLASPGSGTTPALIDLSKELSFVLKIEDMVLQEGEAKLPAGTLASDGINFDYLSNQGERFYQMNINAVQVEADFTSNLGTPVKFRVRFPHILRNNIPIVEEFILPPASPAAPFHKVFNFSNTVWRFDQLPARPYNQMTITYEAFLDQPSGIVYFNANQQVGMDLHISNLQVQEVRGYFGYKEELIDPGTINLEFNFSRFTPASTPILFENPTMKITAQNAFGIPFRAEFNVTGNGIFGTNKNLNPPPLNLNFPLISEIGTTKNTNLTIDKSNSDIVSMMSVYPSSVNYSGKVKVNPDNDNNQVNFIQASSTLSASAAIDLPIAFRVNSMVFRDSVDELNLTLPADLTFQDIDSAGIKMIYTNGLPLRAIVDIIALQAGGAEVRVVRNVALDAASVNSAGVVPPNGKKDGSLYVRLSGEDLQTLDDATQIIFEVRFQTGNNGILPASLFTDYAISLKVGLDIKFDVN